MLILVIPEELFSRKLLKNGIKNKYLMIIKLKIKNKLIELKSMVGVYFHIEINKDNNWDHIEYGLKIRIYLV